MTNTQRMKVHVYHNATANTLFTREEALMLQLLCTALDQRNSIVAPQLGHAAVRAVTFAPDSRQCCDASVMLP